MQYSLTLTSLVVLVIKHILSSAGMTMPDSDIHNFVSVLVDISCTVGIYVGRMRMGDITWFGKRK